MKNQKRLFMSVVILKLLWCCMFAFDTRIVFLEYSFLFSREAFLPSPTMVFIWMNLLCLYMLPGAIQSGVIMSQCCPISVLWFISKFCAHLWTHPEPIEGHFAQNAGTFWLVSSLWVEPWAWEQTKRFQFLNTPSNQHFVFFTFYIHYRGPGTH